MRIVLLAGRLPRAPWAAPGIIARITRELSSRGHTLTLLCESADDPALFAVDNFRARSPHEQNGTDWPIGLARWARVQARAIEHEASLSLTWLIGGDVWFPLGPSPRDWLESARRMHGPLALARAVARHRGVLLHAAPRPPGASALPCRVGDTANGPRSATSAHERGTTTILPPFSLLDLMHPTERTRLRVATRSLLGLGEHRTVLAISLREGVGPRWPLFLETLVRIVGRMPTQSGAPDPRRITAPPAPIPGRGAASTVVLVLAPDAFRAHEAALASGTSNAVRVLGLTASPQAALCACDAALALGGGSAARPGSTGRFIADALRLGRPVLAAADAPGVHLLGDPKGREPQPGLVLEPPGVTAAAMSEWEQALRRVSHDAWLATATAAAERASSLVDPMRFFDVLEDALTATASRRRAPAPRPSS